ncbi:hypothetical protein ACIOTI_31025 [Streptomyces sp. NPDC087843]|uniref:hypothetical protein n=1 Tax=Streptomyces sp. NPDC087843 TaxID=3365804 RepID=UPI003808FD54
MTDWQIERCEVELDPEFAQESLAVADGPAAPPHDPADRKAWHSERPTVEDDSEGHGGAAGRIRVGERLPDRSEA